MPPADPAAPSPSETGNPLPEEGGALTDALTAALLEAPLVPVDQEAAALPDPTGDHILNPDFAQALTDAPLKPAAVLIAVDASAPEPDVVLTVRTSNLSSHAGQIAFPGGRIDPGEAPKEAALREALEEIALPTATVRVQGFLPSYASRTGYRVYPVVGLVDGWPALTANPGEVDDIFYVPLRFLLDPANARQESRIFEGRERFFYSYTYADRRIWGLTAGIIHHMSQRVVSNRR
ncbi:MAG: CoA pyrophosphatase [Devosiaceae bacterium]|nr:CoA pyrophosphatase [Devosiaceae bacterium MH13]